MLILVRRDGFAGLESWEDPTPRPSPFTLKELGDAWVAAAKRQLIRRPKTPPREELLRRSQEHDQKSLIIALNVYAKQNNMQVCEHRTQIFNLAFRLVC